MSILSNLIHAAQESPFDIAALMIFSFCWLGYEPFLQHDWQKPGLIIKDLSVVRAAWMKEMTVREIKLFDFEPDGPRGQFRDQLLLRQPVADRRRGRRPVQRSTAATTIEPWVSISLPSCCSR